MDRTQNRREGQEQPTKRMDEQDQPQRGRKQSDRDRQPHSPERDPGERVGTPS